MSFKKIFSAILNLVLRKRSFKQYYNLLKYRTSHKKEILSYKPIYLTILPIHRCNLSCKMCLTHSKEIQDNIYRHKYFDDMTFEMFKDIVSHFKEALAVGFMGNGEPLLNKDIFKMIEYAEVNGKMRTAMITNGIILNNFSEQIINSHLCEICISINGHNENEFQRMTGMPKTHFSLIIESAKNLIDFRNKLKSKLRIGASIVIDKTNLPCIQEMIDFAKAIRFDQVSFYNILPLTEERAKQISLYDSPETLNILRKIDYSKSEIQVGLPVPLDKNLKNNICDDFFTSINIDGAGNVGGCNRQKFNIYKSGKYFDQNVWNNEYFRNERRKFLNNDLQLDEPCKVCSANSSYIKNSIESLIGRD